MSARITYCRDCPLRNAKEKELKGVNNFYFTPPERLQKCYDCHLKQIEEAFRNQREIERQANIKKA